MEKLTKHVEKVITEAIKLEINGQSFFNHAAEVTHNELGKKMFLRLAEEEVKHLEAFSRLFTDIIKDKDWKKYVKKEELEGESPVIEELKARMQRAEGKSEIEALRGWSLSKKPLSFLKNQPKNLMTLWQERFSGRYVMKRDFTTTCFRRSMIQSPILDSGWIALNSRWTENTNLHYL